MIEPGWRKRYDVCPACKMPGRVSERLSGDDMGIETFVIKNMEMSADVCDNCGTVYVFKAEKAEIPELSKGQMDKAARIKAMVPELKGPTCKSIFADEVVSDHWTPSALASAVAMPMAGFTSNVFMDESSLSFDSGNNVWIKKK